MENAFGLLVSVFRVFKKPIKLKVLSLAKDVVLACVHFHNFLRSRADSQTYIHRQGALIRTLVLVKLFQDPGEMWQAMTAV